MQTEFYKYHGAGNDFIIIDDRKKQFPEKDISLIHHLCDRRFGIGADGLILLQSADGYDFRMVYYNADGNESTMCGNGGRCIVRFANDLGLIASEARFIAIDGSHEATLLSDQVILKMSDVHHLDKIENDYFLDTGSPHYVRYVENLGEFDVFKEGKAIRNTPRFIKEGTNVNFIETISDDQIAIRTYERGVEDETLACGTGVTAAAIVHGHQHHLHHLKVKAVGGDLEVKFEGQGPFREIWLKGPTAFVFKGMTNV